MERNALNPNKCISFLGVKVSTDQQRDYMLAANAKYGGNLSRFVKTQLDLGARRILRRRKS